MSHLPTLHNCNTLRMYAMGFLVTPLFGWVQDKFKLHLCTLTVVAASVAWQTLWLTPSLHVQYLTFAIYSSSRQIIFSWYYSAVAAVFGYNFYGRCAFFKTLPLFFSNSFPSLLAVTSISNTVVGLTQPLIVAPSIASADFEQLNSGLVATMAVAGALCCFFLMTSYRRTHALVQAQQQLRSAV
jgi:hypothetical protein